VECDCQNSAPVETRVVFNTSVCSVLATLHVFVFIPPSDAVCRQAQELLISRLMEGKTTNWELAKRCAEQIRSPEYTTRHFHAAWSKAWSATSGFCAKWQRQNIINETSVY